MSPSPTPGSLLEQAIGAHHAGELDLARRLYEAAIVGGCDDPAGPYNLGTLLVARGQLTLAVESFAAATRLQPDFKAAHYNLGTTARRCGELALARESLTAALRLDPAYHDARVNLSLVLFESGEVTEAISVALRALEEHPDDPDVFANLASFLRAIDAADDAKACLNAALRLDPRHADAWVTMGALAHDAREYATAVVCHRRAVAASPQHPAAHWNLGLALLAQGDYEQGWAEYEWRTRLPHMIAHYPDLGIPTWNGEDLAGKTLLLVSEQGHGDTLQFVRLADVVRRRGARVVLVTQPGLVRLLKHCRFLDEVLPEGRPTPTADFALPLLSLPQRLHLTLSEIPNAPPYLEPDPRDVGDWRRRLGSETRPKIGLVWAGAPRPSDPESNRVDARRSLPLAVLGPVLDRPDLAFYSLQKGDAGCQAAALSNVIDLTAKLDDFADTAALIAQLDLVITVDTAVAHLAAGLSRPTWLLSRHDACWRWLGNQPNSPWYPSLRIFGQPGPGDWQAVVQTVAAELARFIPGTRPA